MPIIVKKKIREIDIELILSGREENKTISDIQVHELLQKVLLLFLNFILLRPLLIINRVVNRFGVIAKFRNGFVLNFILIKMPSDKKQIVMVHEFSFFVFFL